MKIENIQQLRLENEYMKRWYSILCDTQEREKEFIENFYEDGRWLLVPRFNSL